MCLSHDRRLRLLRLISLLGIHCMSRASISRHNVRAYTRRLHYLPLCDGRRESVLSKSSPAGTEHTIWRAISLHFSRRRRPPPSRPRVHYVRVSLVHRPAVIPLLVRVFCCMVRSFFSCQMDCNQRRLRRDRLFPSSRISSSGSLCVMLMLLFHLYADARDALLLPPSVLPVHQIVAVIICDTGIALLAYMDGTSSRTIGPVVLAAAAAVASSIYKVSPRDMHRRKLTRPTTCLIALGMEFITWTRK